MNCSCMQGAAALWLIASLSRKYSLSLAGRSAMASLSSFLGPTGASWEPSPTLTQSLECDIVQF